jgi:hypothetical protein
MATWKKSYDRTKIIVGESSSRMFQIARVNSGLDAQAREGLNFRSACRVLHYITQADAARHGASWRILTCTGCRATQRHYILLWWRLEPHTELNEAWLV